MSKILCRILLLIVIIAIEIVCAQASCFCYHRIAESEEEGIIAHVLQNVVDLHQLQG